jgi:hypothetical protein
MPKQTKLGDDAYIYQAHQQQTEKEKLRDMPFKGKINYLWEYYKLHAMMTVIVLAAIIYFIYTMLNPSATPKFSAAMIDNTIKKEVLDQYAEEFSAKLQLNTKKESVEFNTNYNFNADAEYVGNMKQALVAYIQSAQIDVIIAPESIFKEYAHVGTFSELSDQLPTDIYSSLTNDFYLTDTEEDKEKKAYGIDLSDTKLYKSYANYNEPYILGIVANYKHKANTIEFIKYLFDEK